MTGVHGVRGESEHWNGLLTLKKNENGSDFVISCPPPGPRLDRTQSEIIRITLAIRRLYAQSDAKVIPK